MKTLIRFAAILFLAAWALSGCETTKQSKPYDDDISLLPQNRPQGWEGSAAMGSFFPTAR